MKPVAFLIAGVVLGLAVPARAAVEPAEVALHECLRCATPPVIDGRLDDACYAPLPVMDHFYKYWSPVPLPPPLRTAARLCYDDRGLYMGVTMFEEQLDKIKAEVTGRDNPETWHDDCVEIMIDPHNTGTGYFKFTTNLNAVRHDQKATNLVLDDGWSVEGWKVATSRGEGAWFIEFFLPWDDIDARPRDGDIWSFDLVRYGWASGAFKGVSWSLGGAGAAPAKFGYLHFGPLQPLASSKLKRLAGVIRPTKSDSFRFILPPTVYTHEPKGKWRQQELTAWLGEARAVATGELTEAQTVVQGLPDGADKERLTKAAADVSGRMGELAPTEASSAHAVLTRCELLHLARRAAEVKWEAKVWELVSAAGK